MPKIKFIYMKNISEIEYKEKDLSIQNLLIKYSSIIDKHFNELFFFYKGKKLILNKNKKVNELKDKNIIIFVYNWKIKKNNNNKEFEEIICPECNNLAIINTNNNKISFNCLKNNHKFIDISLNYFKDIQYIDESLIYCQKCGNNKCYYNKFYICSNNKNICPLCLNKNNNEYNILDYEYRFNYCINHSLNYKSFCHTCNINLCEKCEEEHMVHKIKNYKEIKPNNKKINDIKKDEENIYKYKEELKRINEYFNDYINDFIDDLINDLDIYINIYKIIIINSSNNYENIKNILDFKPKELMSDINDFLKEKNKLKNLINLWETKKNKIKKEINIIYKKKKW